MLGDGQRRIAHCYRVLHLTPMDFRDYAAGEVSELLRRLATTHSDATLRAAREALSAALEAVESAAAPPDTSASLDDLVGRLSDAADASVARVRTELQGELTSARSEAERLKEALDAETARATALESDLDAVIEAHREVDAARVQAEAERDEQARERTSADREREAVRDLLEAARKEQARLKEALEAESAGRAVVEAELSEQLEEARGAIGPLRSEIAHVQQELEAERARVAQLHASLTHAREESAAALASAHADAARLQDAVDAAEATAANMRAEHGHALDAAQQALAAARAESARTEERIATEAEHRAALETEVSELRTALSAHSARLQEEAGGLDAAARAIEEMSSATTIADLFAAAARHLATRFERAATFRVKDQQVEGEHAFGVEGQADIGRLSLPMSADSVITRAASRGVVEEAGAELAQRTTPFGGQPEAALAFPVAYQDGVFAVVYVDSPRPLSLSQRGFASILVNATAVLLTRLGQELKTARELADYAALLLQEAEHMLLSDLEAGRPEKERRKRLFETLECARQLYAQRAALEGTAVRLLEDEIENLITSPDPTPFAQELAAACALAESRRGAAAR